MTDLTQVTHQMCSSMTQHVFYGKYTQRGMFDERSYPTCTCSAYRYSPKVVNFGGRKYPVYCKHIEELYDTVCTWHSIYGEFQEVDGVCPRCGSKTVPIVEMV